MGLAPKPWRRACVRVAASLAALLGALAVHAQQPLLVPGQPIPLLAPPPPQARTPLQEATRLARRGEPAAALAILDKQVADDPRDVRSRFLRGIVLSDLKRTPEAIEAFAALTREYPELTEPYNNLAVLHAGEGRYDEARRALEQALVASPQNATARANLGDIYVQLAREAYERALAADPKNRALRAKLTAIGELGRASPPESAPASTGESK